MNSKHLLAISGLAIGIATAISAAPAGAVSFNGGQLNFTGLTSDFYTQLNSTAVGGNFTIGFNPGSSQSAIISNTLTVPSGTNTAASLTPGTFQPISVIPSSGTFTRTSINSLTLQNSVSFAFTDGTTVNIGANNIFSIDSNNSGGVNIGFANGQGTGTIFNGADGATAQVLTFNLTDGATTGGGNYGIVAGPINPTAIPEPFTIIGTLVGGTVALRMRKKLIASVNK
jgi:hypothetical protein